MSIALTGRRAVLSMMAGLSALPMGRHAKAQSLPSEVLRYRGVVYDVGFRTSGEGPYSVGPFNPALVRYDIQAIAQDLHANAVRIEGEEISRLHIASRAAREAGLGHLVLALEDERRIR